MNRTTAANGSAAPAVEAQAEPGLLERVVEATHDARQFSLEEVRYMAEATAKSDMYGLSQSQAFVLMMIAESERLHPVQALRRFHIVEGKPSMRADAMQAEFQRHGGRLRWVKSNAEECEAEFWHPVYHPDVFTVRVTLKELVASEVAMQWPKRKEGEPKPTHKVLKNTYKQFPRQMLRARVISEGVRAIDPGVVVGIYTPEEVSDFDDRPSPRPLPVDAPASRPEPVTATAEAPAEPAPQPDGFWSWLQARVDDANNDWASFCAKERLPHKKLVEHVNEALNGVITMWLEKELIRPEQVNGSKKGTRSNSRMRNVIDVANDEDEHATQIAFELYFHDKWAREATALGVNLDSEPAEAPSNA